MPSVLRFTTAVAHKSAMLEVPEAHQSTVTNRGAQNAWQSVRSQQSFVGAQGARHSFEVLLASSPKTTNSWMAIVGVVPAEFSCQVS